jgi:hypothetical protein
MTDRELWVKTYKTVGAMTGGTLVLLGSMSLLLILVVGRPSAPSPSDAASVPTTMQGGGDNGKVDAVPPPTIKSLRHAAAVNAATAAGARPGESI